MSESIAQIFLVDNGYLDVSEDVLIPMSWNVNDVKQPGNRGSAWSKNIMLFGTDNNNRILGDLFDVNIITAESSFNKNIKYKCVILRNGEPAFDGYFRLLNVTKKSPSYTVFDEEIVYECQIYDALASMAQDIQNKYLEDIDLSQYDHELTFSAITATSAHTWINGYKYHNFYLDQARPYETLDYRVGIFAPVYFNHIFSGADYTYTWESFSSTSFDKTFIPFNGDKVNLRPGILDEKRFYAGFSASTGLQVVPTSFSGLTLRFNDDSSFEHFDSGNTYNPATGVYTANFNGNVQFKTKFKYEFYFSSSTSYEVNAPISLKRALSLFLRSDNAYTSTGNLLPANTTVGYYMPQNINTFTQPTGGFPDGYIFNSGLTLIDSGTTDEMTGTLNMEVYPGMTIHNSIGISNMGSLGSFVLTGTSTPAVVDMVVRISEESNYSADTNNNYWLNLPAITEINEGETVFVNDFIPKKIKQNDFLTSIIRKYNLFFVPSKANEKHVDIFTRDEYYDSGETWDFDRGEAGCYLATNENYKISWVQDSQNKIIRLKDKEDNDLFNSEYKRTTQETYGQIDYVFPSQHITGENDLSTIFSPTPINEELSFGNLVSTIPVRSPKNNIRFLYDCGWIAGNEWKFRHKTNGVYTETIFSGYPHAGHFINQSDPDQSNLDPEEDLNFGLCDFLFYNTWTQLTNNNQYNRFWRRHFSQLENGRILTGLFKLTDRFIRNFKMNDKIYVLNTYWNISKISDYDFNSDSLTQMELVEVDEGLRFSPFRSRNLIARPADRDFAYIGNAISLGNIEQYGNTLGGKNSNINFDGFGNTAGYGTKSATIVGTGNTINESGTFVFGDDNFIQDGSEKSFVIGNNITATTSGTAYISNLTILSSITISSGATFILTGTTFDIWSSSTGSNSIIANNYTGNYVGSAFGNILGGSGNFIN